MITIRMKTVDNSRDNIKTTNPTTVEFLWNEISKIGDIVLLNRGSTDTQTSDTTKSTSTSLGTVKCSSCGHLNERDAAFVKIAGKGCKNQVSNEIVFSLP